MAIEYGINPAPIHRVEVIAAGTLQSRLRNDPVATLLVVCGATYQ
jgi:hypothetical protein